MRKSGKMDGNYKDTEGAVTGRDKIFEITQNGNGIAPEGNVVKFLLRV
ncbi:MAG TPA: hypothetical protein VK154_00925 [Chitinophagales bacterium]|nr:hypothetical protein [Chitinophagales bacterium]